VYEGMQLRRTSACACVRIGLVAVALGMAASTPALGASEKPKPDALWKAFPLDPASERPLDPARERPASPFLPPTQGRSEATTVTDASSDASGPNVVLLAFATLLVLLATVVVLSGRHIYVGRRHRRSSLPLWQGLAWPHGSDNVRELRQSQVRTSSALVGRERRAAEPHPDVPAPRYRWANRARGRRSRPSVGIDIGRMIRRLRRAVWTEDTAPAIVGGAVAVVVGVLLVYLIG
jgi:hypothetical protein